MKITSYLFLTFGVLLFGCKKNSTERIPDIISYTGSYTSQGYYYHPSGSRTISKPKTLYVHSATSVICEIGDIPFAVTGDSAWCIILDVDPLTNLVSISGTNQINSPGNIITYSSGLPALSNYTPQWPRSSECSNVYDPINKEFKIRYGYYQGNNSLRVIEEIITKL